MREQEEVNLNLRVLGVSLKKHIAWIVLTGILASLAAYLYTELFVSARYESVTKLYVLGRPDGGDVTYNDLAAGSQIAKDYMELVKSRPVIESVIAEQELGISYAGMAERVTVTAPADTRILEIAVRDVNPMQARETAEAIQKAVIRQIGEVMDVMEVNVAEPPNLPETPVSPDVRKRMAAAGGLGGAIAFLGAVILLLMDDKIKSSDDVRRYLDISLLGMIPLRETAGKETGRRKRKDDGKGRGKGFINT